MKLNHVIVVLVIALAVAMLHGTEAKKFQVGGDLGWTIPPGGAATYASWASKYTFKANKDLLGFNFKAEENDVIIVTKENFDICNTTKPLFQYKGPVALAVASSGTYYFTCSFAGHCDKGQKVAIHFDAPSLARAHSAAPSPSPSASDEAVGTEQLKLMVMA